MAAIEIITSQEREVKVRKPNGEKFIVLVAIWNKTVSNLTLMALGSSAPEILLSIIEIFGNKFEAGDLGPSTIVGSAAFNYFIIVGICIAAIPKGEKRRIEQNVVFWVTFFWSIFAYIWLYLILCVFSPNVVEVWEGVLTFLFFFVTVINSYIADRFTPILKRKILGVNKMSFRHPPIQTRSNTESTSHYLDDLTKKSLLENKNCQNVSEIEAFQSYREKFVKLFQKIRHENPDLSLNEIGCLVTLKVFKDMPKSRAFRRLQASHQIKARCQIQELLSVDVNNSVQNNFKNKEYDKSNLNKIIINFQPSHYICAENIGTLQLHVKCDRGKFIQVPTIVTVHYKTVPGTAKPDEDYIHTDGVLVFPPNVDKQTINVKIVNNDVYEFDEEFFVRLYDLQAISSLDATQKISAKLGTAHEALVIILDDDHAGNFGFESQVQRVSETQGVFYLTVKRHRGACGKVILPYVVTEGRAKKNVDFECDDGELFFDNNQIKAYIQVKIINDNRYEKSEDFFIELKEPKWKNEEKNKNKNKNNTLEADGQPSLSKINRCKIIIKEDDVLKGFVDRLVGNTNSFFAVGTSSWYQQFKDAFDIPKNIKIDNVNEIEDNLNCFQLFLHYLSLPWKIIFAFIPPTDYLHGWLCFFIAIVLIGILTALLGDVAAMFGCTLNIKDSVTAITLVALGTSLPDTFASKLSAVQDKTADASIGNVTGSNAVNVFLGIGVAWAIAAIYHSFFKKDVFYVHVDSLATPLALFLIGAILCTIVLQFRRYHKNVQAELGGSSLSKYTATGFFFLMWIIYITYCILDAYCLI